MTKINFEDSITSIAYDDGDNLIASSWDGHIVLLAGNTSPQFKSQCNVKILNQENNIPQLACCFIKHDSNLIASIGLNNTINIYSKEQGYLITSRLISKAQDLFKLESAESFLITADRHKSLFLYDDRTQMTIASYTTSSIISQMKLIENKSLICSDKDNIFYYDIRKLNKPFKVSSNIFSTDIEAIGYIPQEALIYGGSEGKISIEYFDENKYQNYSYKCHRTIDESGACIYSVNAIIYDSQREVFFSGGSDGYIYGWDCKDKKRLFKSKRYDEPISHLVLNKDSSIIAIGVSWLNEDGIYNTTNHKYYIDIIDVDQLS